MPQIILFIFLTLTIIGFLLGNYLYVVVAKRSYSSNKIKVAEENEKYFMDDRSYFKTADAEHRYIQSGDNLLLHARLYENNSSSWVIICHPYRTAGIIMSGFAKIFSDMGFSVLAADMRGHGASEGNYIGMGWHDSFDVIAWIDFLNEEKNADEILLFGVSMGAATVMMTAGHELPDNVKGVIEDCGYSSVKEELKHILKSKYKICGFPIINFASAISNIRAGYSFRSDGDVILQLKKSRLPILFIHGEDDRIVPLKMMEKLYNSAAGEKEKLIIPSAGHARSIDTDKKEYLKALYSFVFKHFNIAGK